MDGEAILDAVRCSDDAALSSLLFHDADPIMEADLNFQDSEGKTALHSAVEQCAYGMVETLLQHPALDPNLQDSFGYTAVYLACQNEVIDCLGLLLADPRVNVNIPQIEGATPLLASCENNQDHVVDLLLAHPEIDPSLADIDGNFPLMVAVGYANVDLARKLLAHPRCGRGEDAVASGFTPFHAVCEQLNEQITELFFEYGVGDVNHQQVDGKTVLFMACLQSRLRLVQQLLFYCPDIDCSLPLNKEASIAHVGLQSWTQFLNKFDQPLITPKDVAIANGSPEIVELLSAYEVDPDSCRHQLGLQLGITGRLIAETFALTVLHCDEFFTLKPQKATSPREERARRFFHIASQLHLDLQMVLCNRAHGLSRTLIPHTEREAAFDKWTRLLK